MWARKSNDNGATWLPDEPFSDVVTPLPAQPDPGILADYAGDYDYASALVIKHLTAWDGRAQRHRRRFPAGCLHRQGARGFRA